MEAIHVADVVPDLFGDLPGDEVAGARAAAVAPVTAIPPGVWRVDANTFNRSAMPGGALVATGLLSRSVWVGRNTVTEFVGPGDVLRPWVQARAQSPVGPNVRWVVHDAAQLGLLDRGFLETVNPWPEVMAALMDRVMLRAYWLARQLAIVAEQRADSRVLLLLWHLADRWGRPDGDGIWLPVNLTHELLAGAVGASRPTVSTAVARLQRAGVVSRRSRGTWVLHGDRPKDLPSLEQS